MGNRQAVVERATKETKISVELDIDGSGSASIESGIPFFDHMLDLFTKHGLFDLTIKADGDTGVDAHHTVEDAGICLGQAFGEALGDKAGIARYGYSLLPMDECLVLAAADISGRPHLNYDIDLPVELIGTFDTSLVEEFLKALAGNMGLTLHIRALASGNNAHHIIEAVFKALGRALDMATALDPRVKGIPSTKGSL
ncbi:MAG: imidazoleglycerol-phosphate dehydratase HisB [Actinomycetota bacterium]